MTAEQKLRVALAGAYQASVLGRAGHGAAAFAKTASADVLTAARAEHDRLAGLEAKLGCPLARRDFAAAQHLEFLRAALAAPAATITQHQEDDDMPSKLKALAGLAKDKVANVEMEAEAAIDRLGKAEKRALSGVSKVHAVAGEIEQSASELDDFANQTSNFPPADEK